MVKQYKTTFLPHKYKRLYTPTLKFTLFIVSFFSLTCQIESSTYYVKPNGNDGNAGTTWSTAWKTIQKAADTITNFEVVYISNGIYFEQIQVTNKNNVQFIGYGSNVMITGQGTKQYGFRLENCTNNRLVNFELYSNIYSMIYLTNSKNCVISNSIFHDNAPWYDDGNAIKLFNSMAKISVRYNTAYGYYDGIHFGNNGHIAYNNLTYSNYNKNILNAGDNGGPWNQYV